MRRFFAVATTAALALITAGLPAAAQDDKITIEGLIFLDRDGDRVHDADESPKAGIGMKAFDLDAREFKWTFTTGADGRYRAVLPKGPKYSVGIDFNGDHTANRAEWILGESRQGADFALNGYFVSGFTFADANGDGEKQGDERTHTGKIKVAGRSVSGAEVNVETTSGPDGAYNVDLPLGDYTLTAPDLRSEGLAPAAPRSDRDIDWLTGTYRVTTAADIRNKRLDLRYFTPKPDAAIEDVTVSPDKDTYTVGEQVDLKVELVNKGDLPGTLSVIMFNLAATDVELLSLSDNVTGGPQSFDTVAKVLPGQSLTVEMKLRLVGTGLEEIYPFLHPNVGGFKDVDRTNQGQAFRKLIKVVEKGTTTPPSETTTTTAPPTTTTTTAPVVPQAGSKSGLASTGVSPLGFIALGGLLLVAGAGVFLVARRRRS